MTCNRLDYGSKVRIGFQIGITWLFLIACLMYSYSKCGEPPSQQLAVGVIATYSFLSFLIWFI